MDRKEIYNEVEEILEQYCKGCFLYKQNRKERGRNFAHRFCITSMYGRGENEEMRRKVITIIV